MERKTCIVERAMLVGLGVAWSIAPETCGTRFHRVAGDNNGSVVESNLIFRSEVGIGASRRYDAYGYQRGFANVCPHDSYAIL